MKKPATLLLFAFLVSCSGNKNEESNSSDKKYDLESGIITFSTTMKIGERNITQKKILYFEDYGIRECEEEYTVDTASGQEILDSKTFVKDGYYYTCSIADKTGVKTKTSGYGVATSFRMHKDSTAEGKKYAELDTEKICGKSCDAFSMESPSGTITQYGWKRILLKTIFINPATKTYSETVAIKIEENVSIPSDKFEIPDEVVIKDM
ncbi:MAG: hypothetical protein AABY93_03600 [Bacteroidota bacterium]